MRREPFLAATAGSRDREAAPLIRRLSKLSRRIWRYTATGVRLYAHAMTGMPPANNPSPAKTSEPTAPPPMQGRRPEHLEHPDHQTQSAELSMDERLWLLELKER